MTLIQYYFTRSTVYISRAPFEKSKNRFLNQTINHNLDSQMKRDF